MKTRPILFNAEAVQAILAGRKTQTRRPVKPQPQLGKPWRHGWTIDPQEMDVPIAFCPYGIPGDRLWVRETWAALESQNSRKPRQTEGPFWYKADRGLAHMRQGLCRSLSSSDAGKWRPSIHMPRWASRLTLEVTAVRVERVQNITSDDAQAEGCKSTYTGQSGSWWYDYTVDFIRLWDSIYARRGYGWSANPWVWVVEFKAAQ